MKALLYKKFKDKKVRCLACNNYCIIPNGATGLCGVRQNKNGVLNLLVYGQAAALAVDPIEKKPLFHFLPGAKILSVGTLGCNFGCDFCQNWNISQATKTLREKYKGKAYELQIGKLARYGQKVSPKQLVDYALKHRIPALAFTYNEPAIFFEYAYDTIKLAKKHGLKTVFVSNGYESKESLVLLKGKLDALNIDLKSMNPQFYLKTCKARLEPVLKNIKQMHEMGFWLELTTLLIPGLNDSNAEIKKATEFIKSVSADIPWHLTAFHPDYKMLDVPETPHDILLRAYKIAKDSGLKYVYLGNVYDPEKESTFCPKCNKLLIRRVGYSVEILGLNKEKGTCSFCGQKIAGVFVQHSLGELQ